MSIANGLLLAFALIQGALLVWSFRSGRSGLRVWIIRALLFGTCFDNAVQGLGFWMIDQPWFEGLSQLRYVLHALFLPFLVVFAIDVLAKWHIEFAQKTWAVAGAWILTLAGVCFGLYTDLVGHELVATEILGVHKYIAAETSPPLATIVSNLVVIVLAVILWRKVGWPWLCIGALTIFAVNAGTAPFVWGFLAGNLAEVFFIGTLILTDQRLVQRLSGEH